MTTSGAFTEYSPVTDAGLRSITVGPDGNLWFTSNNYVGRITLGGTISEFNPDNASGPWGITAGPDGDLWFTENNANRIAHFPP